MAVATLVTFVVSSACGAGAKSAEGSALQDALTKTLAADGFHIEGITKVAGEDFQAEGDYVAPDRFFMETSDARESSTTIIVGRNYYGSEPEDAERFSLWEMPCEFGVDTFIPALSILRGAEDVSGTDGGFTFHAAGNEGTPIEGEARVENGYLVALSVQYSLPDVNELVHERWIFSDFGATVSIEPPPANQVVDPSEFGSDPLVSVGPTPSLSCPS